MRGVTMQHLICVTKNAAAQGRRGWGPLCGWVMLSALATGAGVAAAQSAPAPAQTTVVSNTDPSLTWHGITLYGIVDIGLQNQTHGAPISDFYPAGSANLVQKNSNHSITAVPPSNLSQSRVGLQGSEPIAGDWSGVFKLETFFNPQSGQI